jgi:hypothetical protein
MPLDPPTPQRHRSCTREAGWPVERALFAMAEEISR